MKKLILASICCISFCHLTAQTEDCRINTILLPNSPAASIIGISNSQIEKPSTPQDFAVSMLSNTQNFTVIPANLSLQLAPFQVFKASKSFTNSRLKKDKDDLDFKNLPMADFRNKHILSTIANTFVVSAATSPGYLDDSLSIIKGALGLKFTLAKFGQDKDTSSADDLPKCANNMRDFDKYVVESKGTSLDFGAACAWDFRDNKFESIEKHSRFSRYSVWLTFHSRTKMGKKDSDAVYDENKKAEDNLYFLATARILTKKSSDLTSNDMQTFLDLGARIIYTIGDRFSISGEILYRRQFPFSTPAEEFRVGLNADYRIRSGNIVSIGFNRDFNSEFNVFQLQQNGKPINPWALVFNIVTAIGNEKRYIDDVNQQSKVFEPQ